MLMISGDELAAKDLIDKALKMDSFKWVSLFQKTTYTILTFLSDIANIYLL